MRRRDAETFAHAADAAAGEVEPLADIRGSAAYKREMVRVHVRRALRRRCRRQPTPVTTSVRDREDAATAAPSDAPPADVAEGRRQGFREVGRSVPRLESTAKVDGSVEYIYNLRLPGMLHGKIHRSSIAHGRIVRIDAGAALALEGVHAVVTSEDVLKLVPNPYYGPAFHDQPILALEKVRHVGEPVAVVLATDPHIAEEAADLIVVEYDPLEAVFDEVAAARPARRSFTTC